MLGEKKVAIIIMKNKKKSKRSNKYQWKEIISEKFLD